jgi:hypothetical protein
MIPNDWNDVYMNKQQINYLTEKLNAAYSRARNELANKANKEVDDAIRAALAAAGFKFNTTNYGSLIGWVWTDELKEHKLALDKRNSEILKVLGNEYSSTIDHINLGSDADAMAVLESFTAKMKELTDV